MQLKIPKIIILMKKVVRMPKRTMDHTHDAECNDIPLGDDDDDDDGFDRGFITLSFDDGYKSIGDNINLLNDYKSTQYIYSVGVIGATEGGGIFYTDFMTLA